MSTYLCAEPFPDEFARSAFNAKWHTFLVLNLSETSSYTLDYRISSNLLGAKKQKITIRLVSGITHFDNTENTAFRIVYYFFFQIKTLDPEKYHVLLGLLATHKRKRSIHSPNSSVRPNDHVNLEFRHTKAVKKYAHDGGVIAGTSMGPEPSPVAQCCFAGATNDEAHARMNMYRSSQYLDRLLLQNLIEQSTEHNKCVNNTRFERTYLIYVSWNITLLDKQLISIASSRAASFVRSGEKTSQRITP